MRKSPIRMAGPLWLWLLFSAVGADVAADGGASAAASFDPVVARLSPIEHLSGISDMLASERVVYVGEVHTDYEDHLVQLGVLKGLHRNNPDIAIGVEWFPRPDQAALDRYVAGEIDEDQLLEQTGYYDKWRFDFRLYRPVLQYCRANAIPVIALNAAKQVTEAVSLHGLDNLPDDIRERVPRDYDFSNQVYRGRLQRIFDLHPDRGADFDRFVQVQLTWDEVMAETAATYLAGDERRQLLVLAGRGHVVGRYGIPDRIERRTGLRGTTVLVNKGGAGEDNDADYVVFAARAPLPPLGKLGILLAFSDEGIRVKDFVSTSLADEAGLEKDDLLISVDGRKIIRFADLKIALRDKLPGDDVAVSYRRATLFSGEEEGRLTVKLSDSSRAAFRH